MRVFDLILEYQNNYPTYNEFLKEIKLLLEKILLDNNIAYSQIETRIKPLPSFLDKAYRLISNNEHFSPRFNDLLGVRVIAFYLEDVDRIADFIESNFKVHLKNFEYEAQHRAPDQFGYSSKHYKISLRNNFGNIKIEKFKDIIFEVQIRTVAQHAWSIIDHKIRYKTAEEIPQDIQRQIFQLSALFELADSQFLAIKKKLEVQAQEDLEKYKTGDLSAKINALTLGHFFKTHQSTIQSIIDEAVKIGFKETIIQHNPNSLRYLLMLFQRLSIFSMGELEALFAEAQEKGPGIMENIYQVISNKSIIPVDYPFPIILLIVITLRLKVIKFNDIDANKVIQKLLGSSVKSISLSLKQNENNL